MQFSKSVLTLLTVIVIIACNSSGTATETKAANKPKNVSQRNPVVKGRYLCWRLLVNGDEVAPDLYILSDNSYEIGDDVGSYSYDIKTNTIKWIDGPLYQPSESWMGSYTSKGTATAKGGHTLESMIEIRRQGDIDAGNKKVLMQCNCTERE